MAGGNRAWPSEPLCRESRPPWLRQIMRSGFTRPLTTASPRPSAASIKIRSRRPVAGSQENATPAQRASTDRKSTRLNSSHLVISYAVFCLKKKKKTHLTDFLHAARKSTETYAAHVWYH